jgi:PAS domain-containing protein
MVPISSVLRIFRKELEVEYLENLYFWTHGLSTVSYDALGRDQILYEVKTGYGRIFGDEKFRLEKTELFIDQSEKSLELALYCGYDLIWIFNDERVREYFNGQFQVKTEYRKFKCNEDSR